MNPREALAVVVEAASMAPLPKPAHARVDQALLAIAAALGIDLGTPPDMEQPAPE